MELWHPTVPGMDCLSRGHMTVEHTEPGAFPTSDGEPAWASWCLWCGAGVSNEQLDQP